MAWFSAEAVVFDLDDTLLDWSGAQEKALASTFSRHLGHRDATEVEEAFAQVLQENVEAFRRSGRWWYAGDRFQRLLEILDEPQATEPLVDTFSQNIETHIDLLPGAMEALHSTREHGLKVGLLTNGPVPSQRDKFDRLDIAASFDHVAISGETGHWKPAPEAFHSVLRRLGVRPRHAVMVGDSPEFDLAPAAHLGMRTVHIHRQDGCGPVDACAEHPAALLEQFGATA